MGHRGAGARVIRSVGRHRQRPRCSASLKPMFRSLLSSPLPPFERRDLVFQNKAAFAIFDLSSLFFVFHKERCRQNNADKAGYL